MTTAPAAPRGAEIRSAHRIVRTLFTPVPWYYWRELVLTGLAAWGAFLLAAGGADSVPATVCLTALAALLWYRAVAMVHELTHQRRDEIPGFHSAWNVLVGVPWLLPSVMYERVHTAHHKKTTYGTAADPEYLQLAGRPWAVLGYLGFSFVAFPLLSARFLIFAPLSWVVSPLRRVLVRSWSSYVINIWYVRRMSPAERRRLVVWECLILLAWWPPLVLTLAGELPWRWLVCWYAVYTTALLLNRVRMLTAHHFALDGRPTDHLGQFRDSIDTPAGWWAELWAPLGMRYHALHHLFPTLPFHNLRAAYDQLAARLPAGSFYHAATGPGLFGSLRRLVSRRR
ncbi:MAG: Fatty acid desaturase [Gemmataceae bacterium]|nr:Fatty acid desaturase [Gemmataceae bacterium]